MNRCTRLLAAFVSVCLLAVPVDARRQTFSCGTHPEITREALHLHEKSTRRFGAKFRGLSTAERAAAADRYALPDRGDIAVISDADGVVIRRNVFDLSGKSIRFTRTASGSYRFETGDSAYDADAAARGTLLAGLGDDDAAAVDVPFAFPFYTGSYRSLFVNSDGNLSFGVSDILSAERALGRVISGPPRIAPYFTDLDPLNAIDGVRVLAEPSRLVVTWSQVPEYTSRFNPPPQTIQAALYPDGSIVFSYPVATLTDIVVGISPGRPKGDSALVDFTATASSQYGAAVAEAFTSTESVDIFTAAQKFYLNHDDAYDFLVFYNTSGVRAGTSAIAYEATVRNSGSGFGDAKVELGADAGSQRRLQAILNMGPLDQYPTDPDAAMDARPGTGDTPLTILGHETGHRFLAYSSVEDENFPGTQPMLGRDGAHWAFTFNSEASLLEGNRIRDNGNGRFTTIATVEGYSPLDQYLMGLIPKEQVSPTFYVAGANTSATRAPQPGVTFSGRRVNISVDDLLPVVGRRTPDHTVAQRRFRLAFVLIAPDGTEPTEQQLQQVETLRSRFPGFFERASAGKATAETTLGRALHVSTFPAAGLVAGNTATATVTLDVPAAAPLTLSLQTAGAAAVPSTVTIPAGSSQANFQIAGAAEGLDELTITAGAPGYETSVSRLQVSARDTARLAIFSGNLQAGSPGRPLPSPIVVRLTDVNELPYAGIRVDAAPSAGGTVSPQSVLTDTAGRAQFSWTPGSGATNELQLTSANGSVVTATTLGRPALTSAGVVNSATFMPGIAPGSIASAFGVNLAGDGLQLTINGTPVQIFYADSKQVNFYVPAFIAPGTAQIAVSHSGGASETIPFSVASAAPGIFFDAASRYAAVIYRPDRFIEIYATGLAGAQAQALLDGVPMLVPYSGAAPGFVGLNQINAQLPASAAPGDHTLTLVVNGVRSNDVKLRVP